MVNALKTPKIARAERDILIDEDGRRYIDLFNAFGTVWLGHGDEAVTSAVTAQLGKVWATGALETSALAEARGLIESFFPDSHGLAGLYSTGMEAAEFALRMARVATGRNGVVGFERDMHGKSLATALLGWDNRDGLELPGFHRLPFLPGSSERHILESLRDALDTGTISAVLVEPLQGCGGGHTASPAWHREVARLTSEAGALLVFDEILTGFHRTGDPFLFQTLGVKPDVILIGKAMGNGFPVSGVVADRRIPIVGAMLPGSTFAGNPLAASAVAATLRRLQDMDVPGLVREIESVILDELKPLDGAAGVELRGKGAMWILEMSPGRDVLAVVAAIYGRGVAVGHAGRHIRILPSLAVRVENLTQACIIIREEIIASEPGRTRP
jgi:acetylornithine/succinyldiaminopimelate/putrescine aminotransferase